MSENKATQIKAEIAKQKAVVCLQTDIDILAFVTTFMIMPQAAFIIQQAMDGQTSLRQAVEQIVEIAEKARSQDRAWRPGGKP